MRVLVGDPYYSLEEVAAIIGDLAEVVPAITAELRKALVS